MAFMLIPVDPKDDNDLRILYSFLKARLREPNSNISHKDLPTWEEHVDFVRSQPYTAWYLINANCGAVGATYLTKADEIGIWVMPEWRGKKVGQTAVNQLMRTHPRPRYLANINTANIESRRFFTKCFGAATIQLTMEIINVDRR